MTPANPDNSKPLIYRIADALGITHLVVAVQHSHLISEITGLVDALAGKAPATHFHTSIVNSGHSATMDDDGEFSIGCTSVVISMDGVQGDIEVLQSNADNLKRALRNPDSTPTASSDNLVTSGGVKAALANYSQTSHTHNYITTTAGSMGVYQDGETMSGYIGVVLYDATEQESYSFNITADDLSNVLNPDTTPTLNSSRLITSGGVKAALNAIRTELAPLADTQVLYKSLDKSQGGGVQYIDVDEMFQGGNTQVSLIIENSYEDKVPLVDAFFSQTQDAFAFMTDMVDIPDGAILACRILLCESAKGTSGKYFVVIDGIIEV